MRNVGQMTIRKTHSRLREGVRSYFGLFSFRSWVSHARPICKLVANTISFQSKERLDHLIQLKKSKEMSARLSSTTDAFQSQINAIQVRGFLREGGTSVDLEHT